MTPFSGENRITGEELLGGRGGALGGSLVEMALDPVNIVTGISLARTLSKMLGRGSMKMFRAGWLPSEYSEWLAKQAPAVRGVEIESGRQPLSGRWFSTDPSHIRDFYTKQNAAFREGELIPAPMRSVNVPRETAHRYSMQHGELSGHLTSARPWDEYVLPDDLANAAREGLVDNLFHKRANDEWQDAFAKQMSEIASGIVDSGSPIEQAEWARLGSQTMLPDRTSVQTLPSWNRLLPEWLAYNVVRAGGGNGKPNQE